MLKLISVAMTERTPIPDVFKKAFVTMEHVVLRAGVLLLLGVPVFVIVLLALFTNFI